MKEKAIGSPEYAAFVTELKSRILSARVSAARAVNRDLILLYWDIGRGIVERQKTLGWGESVVEILARDLQKAFPGVQGFSPRNLRDMKRLYLAYSEPKIWRQAVAKLDAIHEAGISPNWRQAVAKLPNALIPKDQSHRGMASEQYLRQAVADIPWGHHLTILNKVADPAARLYYLRATAQLAWSRNVLLNQIKAQTYERALP